MMAAPGVADTWSIEPQTWGESVVASEHVTFSDRGASASKPLASLTTKLQRFSKKKALDSITLAPSVDWLNWSPTATKLSQPNMRNAPVIISTGPNSHWIFACYQSEEALKKQHEQLKAKAKQHGQEYPDFPYSTEGFTPQEVTLEGLSLIHI